MSEEIENIKESRKSPFENIPTKIAIPCFLFAITATTWGYKVIDKIDEHSRSVNLNRFTSLDFERFRERLQREHERNEADPNKEFKVPTWKPNH